jgi:hypothetical protein
MSQKLLMINVGAPGAETRQWIQISDVVKILGTNAGGNNRTSVAMTYESGATVTLTVGTGANATSNLTTAMMNNLIKGIWEVIADAGTQPWQSVQYNNSPWAAVYSPTSQDDAATAANPKNPALAGSVFTAKQSAPVTTQNGAIVTTFDTLA